MPLRTPTASADPISAAAKRYSDEILQRVFQENSRGRVRLSSDQRDDALRQAIDNAPDNLKNAVKKQLQVYLPKESPALARAGTPAARDNVDGEGQRDPAPSKYEKSDQFIFEKFASIERQLNRGPLNNADEKDKVDIFDAALKRAKDPAVREELDERLALAQVALAEKQAAQNLARQTESAPAFNKSDEQKAVEYVKEILKAKAPPGSDRLRFRDLDGNAQVALFADAKDTALAQNETGAANYLQQRINVATGGVERAAAANQPAAALDNRDRGQSGRAG